jgi:AraC-like DNA-binding protein
MDPLSDIIALLHPHAAFSRPITGRGKWGVRYSTHKWPSFSIVLAGQCWLSLEDCPPLLMRRGDFVLLPTTPALALSSELASPCIPGRPAQDGGVRYGAQDGDPDFQMLGGTFSIESGNAPLLLGLLPPIIHMRSTENDTSHLAYIINFIMEECVHERPGRQMLLERLLEVMLIESLRWHNLQERPTQVGLLAGLHHPPIALTLRAMHANVNLEWTVATLAKVAGMSRSAYARHFGDIVGCGPMEYLMRWRMSLAQHALAHGSVSLEAIARDIGYQSASAFSTAFRKRIGQAPGAFGRLRREKPRLNTEASGHLR